MTLHLLPVMRESGEDCRIINVSSMGHTRGDVDPSDFQAEKKFDSGQMYYNSKLFQVRFKVLSMSAFLFFFPIFLLETCPFVGPGMPLFWTSGDVSSGFQSQSGQPYSNFERRTMSGSLSVLYSKFRF